MNSTRPYISIIVPVYNVEKYIDQCLESLVNQTLKEVEIIVIIDGSTDSSEDIARTYAEKYANIQIIKTKNQGLAAARNEGIRYAKGEYLAFIDSDDWTDENMFYDMYNLAKEYNADMVACNFIFEYDDGPQDVQPDMQSKLMTDKAEAIRDVLLSQNMNNCAWNKIYRNTLFKNNIRFTERRYFEDLYPMLQWVNICNCIYLTHNVYYHYRRARGGSITAKFSMKHIDDYAFLVENAHNWLNDNGVLDEFQEEFSTCAFRIYNQLIFNTFFSAITNRFECYKSINEKFPANKYFSNDNVRKSEDNKFLLITILGTMNKNKFGQRISFIIMNMFCSILRMKKR